MSDEGSEYASDAELSEDDVTFGTRRHASEKMIRMIDTWNGKHEGAGAVWCPMRLGRDVGKDEKGDITAMFKGALHTMRGGPYVLEQIIFTGSGVILYIGNPKQMLGPLLEVGQVTIKGEVRPLVVHTKKCVSSYTVFIFDAVDQESGKPIPPEFFGEVVTGLQLGKLKGEPYNPPIWAGGVDTGVKTTNICMQFEGLPTIGFGDWPQTIDIPESGTFPGYEATWMLYVNDYTQAGRCPRCKRKYSVTKPEEAESGAHFCPQAGAAAIKVPECMGSCVHGYVHTDVCARACECVVGRRHADQEGQPQAQEAQQGEVQEVEGRQPGVLCVDGGKTGGGNPISRTTSNRNNG